MSRHNGIPNFGFGTGNRKGPDGVRAIACALEAGYRHIDTAQMYDTEREVGQAFRESGLPRGDVFITTKILPRNFGQGELVPSLEESLSRLDLDQVDLTLIHWPSPRDAVPLEVYINQLADAQSRGLTRMIGVSNFTIDLLNRTQALLGDGKIATNQAELHPYMQNTVLAKHCRKLGIPLTCYLPLARGGLAGDTVLQSIADAHGAKVEQVVLAFEMAKGHIPIPTSGNPEHIRSNFEATRLSLAPNDIAAIEALDRGDRRVDPEDAPDWD